MSATTDPGMQHGADAPFAGRFVLGRALGRGGLADVHQALDLRTGRTIAVRILREPLRQEPGVAEVFVAGARAAARATHPHVLPIHEIDAEHDPPFVVTDIVDGHDLEDLLRRDGPFAPRRAVRLLRQIGSAVDALHEAGVVHGDLKPSNVLVAALPRGEEHAWVIDVAAEQPDDDEEPGDLPVLVTEAYLAPERRGGGPATVASDVYALACLALELLTDERPVPRTGPVIPGTPGVEIATDRRELPVAVRTVLEDGLSRATGRRPASAADLVDRLEAAAAAPDATGPRRYRGRRTAALLAGVVVLLAAGWGGHAVVEGRTAASIPGPESVLLDGTLRWQERKGFRVAVPRGFRAETTDLQASSARWVNRWTEPGTGRFVEIDRLQPRTTTYSQNAAFLDGTRRATPYYERVSMEETVVAGRGAISWAFRDREGDAIVPRVEILFDRGIEGYAFLVGGSGSFGGLLAFARRIAETLETTSSGAATDASGNLVGGG
ncbi:serine/threonine-protein kinase [Patulibacter sp. NPDC049589]|uniref:serine/threonine-protein kinase n=1 Tax=Patulibacter sp. NPDC049589 TaxID=3154731 RepID=UPI00344A0729